MTRHTKPNEWEKRFGAIRRAKDRALLEEVERRIAIEEAVTVAFDTLAADIASIDKSGRPSE